VSAVPAESKTVLVLEDDAVIQDLLLDLLSSEGYRVVQAMDGVSGMNLAEQDRPDAILLDLNIPPTSGLDVLDQLRSSEGTDKIPVLALTADPRPAEGDESPQLDGFIQKPFDISDLLEQVERAVDG
jgi:CheY-like chemotaxis protein